MTLPLCCHYAECHYAVCHYAECQYADGHYAECQYYSKMGFLVQIKFITDYLQQTQTQTLIIN